MSNMYEEDLTVCIADYRTVPIIALYSTGDVHETGSLTQIRRELWVWYETAANEHNSALEEIQACVKRERGGV